MTDKVEQSKVAHRTDAKSTRASDSVFDERNADTLRHHHMLQEALPVLNFFPRPKVLTIGDRLGRDGVFLKKRLKSGRVFVSDLFSAHLSDLASRGLVDGVLDVDVEAIPFDDASFDFVFVKESFHHFPRPWLGFYECARVAKHGVILLEPADVQFNRVLTYPGSSDYRDAYESVGNYKYQINVREAQKVSWAIGWQQLVAKGFNDPYPADGKLNLDAYLRQKAHLDAMGQNSDRPDNLLMLAFLRDSLRKTRTLEKRGYRIYNKPVNPFEK